MADKVAPPAVFVVVAISWEFLPCQVRVPLRIRVSFLPFFFSRVSELAEKDESDALFYFTDFCTV